jgi:predicted RNA-binding protein (virulence factor B family)
MWSLNVNSNTHIGEINTLEVLHAADDGFVLDGGNKGEILLPQSRVPEGCSPGQKLAVFVYPENDGQLVATCNTPAAQVGECALLKVVNVTSAGAFLDWGIQKDLLVPISQQLAPMEEGKSYVVYLLLDPQQRIIGSSKLHRYLDERAKDMAPGQEVDLMIVGATDLGYKAVVNGTHLGLLYKDGVFKPLKKGDRTTGYIKTIREDRKLDLTLRRRGKQSREDLCDRILAHLSDNGGASTLTDYSPPEAIHKEYGVSKRDYKKALGALYKQRKISVDKDRVTLLPPSSQEAD